MKVYNKVLEESVQYSTVHSPLIPVTVNLIIKVIIELEFINVLYVLDITSHLTDILNIQNARHGPVSTY